MIYTFSVLQYSIAYLYATTLAGEVPVLVSVLDFYSMQHAIIINIIINVSSRSSSSSSSILTSKVPALDF